VFPVIKLKPYKKRKNEVEIDKTIETEMGVVHFKGTLTDEEVDYVLTIGLATLMIRGELEAKYATEEGVLIQDGTNTLQ